MTRSRVKLSSPVAYYDSNGITLYHGDCKDILLQLDLEDVDLLLTDPPYGIALDTTNKKYKGGKEYTSIVGDSKPFDPYLLLGFEQAIIWGGNCFASKLPDFPGWIAWVKVHSNNARMRQSEMEIAWTNFIKRPQCFRTLWSGRFRDLEAREPIVHPAQKPIALMRWCIGLAGKPQVILDPYCGSGTTLVAAKELGLKAIGIEIEKKYCRIAVQRLSNSLSVWAKKQ